MVGAYSLKSAYNNVKTDRSLTSYKFYFSIAHNFLSKKENVEGWGADQVRGLQEYFALQLDNMEKLGENPVCKLCHEHPKFYREGTELYVSCKKYEWWPCRTVKRVGCPHLKIALKEKQMRLT